MQPELVWRGRLDYATAFEEMRAFTDARTAGTPDQIWLCEHPPVFTQGLAGKAEHVLAAGDIPVVQTNRGGQVTYHGPGQVVAYPLIDLSVFADHRGASYNSKFRFDSMLVKDGKVATLNVEGPGKFEVSDGATMLGQVK